MLTIEETIAAARAFRNLTPEQLGEVVSLGVDADFADGAYLTHANQPAGWFFVIRRGFVVLETEVASVGAITIETLHDGDSVGWSWLMEPYLSNFAARSRGVTHAIRFDARTLRRRCAEDPVLGYALMRNFASAMIDRLQATRLQLLDVYGRGPVR